jgi:hypothetical protein
VHGTFGPTIPFTLDAAVFAPQALDLQGSTSQSRALEAGLHPSQTGDMLRSRANVIEFLEIHAPALAFRIGGFLLALGGLAIAMRSQRRRRDDIWSHEKRVAFRAGRALIDVVNLEQTLPPGTISTEVANFESLVAVAVQTERPILHEFCGEIELFAAEQLPRLYIYRKAVVHFDPAPPEAEEPVEADLEDDFEDYPDFRDRLELDDELSVRALFALPSFRRRRDEQPLD